MNRSDAVPMRFTQIAIAVWISLFLWSCEGGTTFTKTIDNRSEDTIAIQISTYFGKTDTVLVVPLSVNEVYWNDLMGQFTDESYDCLEMVDSIYIEVLGPRELIKDIMDPGQWERENTGGRNSREDCTFIITESDLQ